MALFDRHHHRLERWSDKLLSMKNIIFVVQFFVIIDCMLSICFDGTPVVVLYVQCLNLGVEFCQCPWDVYYNQKADHDISFMRYSISSMCYAFVAIAHWTRLQGRGWKWLKLNTEFQIWKIFQIWQNFSSLIESNPDKPSWKLPYKDYAQRHLNPPLFQSLFELHDVCDKRWKNINLWLVNLVGLLRYFFV